MLRLISQLLPAKIDPEPVQAQPPAPEAAPGRRKRRKTESEFTSYYGRPVIKKPHWVWPVWTYFWVGGITAGASAITAYTELFGDKEQDYSIIRAGRYISLAGVLVSPVLLIIDLQRPERFHHMLRVLKLRSPLSVGTYILTTTGILSGINAARQVVEDGFIPADSLPGKVALLASNEATTALQGVDGMALGTYTGVLLSATAVPLWAENDVVLPPLFLSSAMSTGAAAITLVRALSGEATETLHRLEPIEQSAIVAELSLITWGFLKTKPEVRKAAFQGIHLPLFAGAIGFGQIIPLLLQLLGPKEGQAGRFIALLNSLLVLLGGFLLRTATIEAGKATADSADAYHSITRGKARPSPEEQAARAGS